MRLLLAVSVLSLLAGCNAASNAQYETPARGGWDNFRAQTADWELLTFSLIQGARSERAALSRSRD